LLFANQRGVTVMKSELKSVFAAITLAVASPVAFADESSSSGASAAPQPGGYYGWGAGMMQQPGYGMGPGMMYGPGYGPGYGMGPGMMYGPGYGQGYGMMYGPGYGPGYGMGPGMMYGPGYGPGYGQVPESGNDDSQPYWGPGGMHGPRYGGNR
jgi:hypothetical protein